MSYLEYPKTRPDANALIKFFKDLKKNPRTQSTQSKPTFVPNPDDGPITIDYLGAPCGSGKTYGLVETAKAIVDQGGIVVISQPTVLLNSETRQSDGFKDWAGKIDVIHTETPVKRLQGRCEIKNDYTPEPGVILTTHGTILNIREPFNGMQNVHLLIDEIPSGSNEFSVEISMHHGTITDHLGIVEESTDGCWVRLEMIDGHEDDLREILKHRKTDRLCEKLFDPALVFLSNSYDVWTRRHSYANLLSGLFKNNDSHILSFYFELRPEIFQPWKSNLIAGANFENSLLYLSFQDKGVVFREDLTTPLRFRSHQNGHLTDIIDFGKEKLSQTWLKKVHDGQSYGQHIANDGAKVFEGEPFTWTENSTLEYNLESVGGERLPNYPFGLNTFSKYHNILCLHAANPTPGFQSFLKWRGRTDDQIWKAIQGESVYQAVTRTSIRDPNSTEMKTIVVASKEAQFLRDLFPINEPNLGDVSKEEKLRSQTLPDQFFTRKSRSDKIHQSEADRKKAYRNHHRKTNVRDKPKGKDGYPSRSDSDGLGFSTATSPLLPSARASIFRKKKDWYHSAIFDGDLFGLFSDTHQRTLGSKEENHLICPAIFDPNQGDGSTKRGLQNIVSIGGFIGFDFENGHLGPDDLTGSVSDNPPWISNSFRHTKENQRFHAFFPLTREVTVEEFNFLWDQIIIRIEARGYSVGKDRKGFKRSGLDTSKRPACSLFYFPCQAADPEASFSIEVWNPIDPDDWLSNPIYPAEGSHVAPEAPRKPRESHPRPSNRPVNPVAVKEATDRWRATPIGQQNAAFYQLGWDYAKAWMPVWDIETTLRMEAEYANNKPERLRQIPAIIRDIEAWN